MKEIKDEQIKTTDAIKEMNKEQIKTTDAIKEMNKEQTKTTEAIEKINTNQEETNKILLQLLDVMKLKENPNKEDVKTFKKEIIILNKADVFLRDKQYDYIKNHSKY